MTQRDKRQGLGATECEGIVRGFDMTEGATSGLGAIVVEVAPTARVPINPKLRELGAMRRHSDGLAIERAIGRIGDWRLCHDTAEALLDQEVTVALGDDGPTIRPNPSAEADVAW